MGETPDPNVAAFEAMQSRLEIEHPHEVVIFQKGRLIATGKDYTEAMERASTNPKSDKQEKFLLKRVGPYEEEVICVL